MRHLHPISDRFELSASPFFFSLNSKSAISLSIYDQVVEFIGITGLDGKMDMEKIADVLNGLADGLGALPVADTSGDAAHQLVPFLLGDFFVDAFIGQQPDFMFKNRDKQQDAVGVACAVKPLSEKPVHGGFLHFLINLPPGDEQALEGRTAPDDPMKQGEKDGEKPEEQPHVLGAEPQPSAQNVRGQQGQRQGECRRTQYVGHRVMVTGRDDHADDLSGGPFFRGSHNGFNPLLIRLR